VASCSIAEDSYSTIKSICCPAWRRFTTFAGAIAAADAICEQIRQPRKIDNRLTLRLFTMIWQADWYAKHLILSDEYILSVTPTIVLLVLTDY
jgi:hypothetical protein